MQCCHIYWLRLDRNFRYTNIQNGMRVMPLPVATMNYKIDLSIFPEPPKIFLQCVFSSNEIRPDHFYHQNQKLQCLIYLLDFFQFLNHTISCLNKQKQTWATYMAQDCQNGSGLCVQLCIDGSGLIEISKYIYIYISWIFVFDLSCLVSNSYLIV